MLQTCIKEVLPVNIGRNTYLEINLDFPQSFYANAKYLGYATIAFFKIIYNSSWPSPAQSFPDPSPAGLMTTFYCLRFEIPPIWRARSPYLYPTGTGWPGYIPRHWVPFSSPHTTRRATVEVFDPVSSRDTRVLSPLQCPLSVS
jgi:hypothetical protein